MKKNDREIFEQFIDWLETGSLDYDGLKKMLEAYSDADLRRIHGHVYTLWDAVIQTLAKKWRDYWNEMDIGE